MQLLFIRRLYIFAHRNVDLWVVGLRKFSADSTPQSAVRAVFELL